MTAAATWNPLVDHVTAIDGELVVRGHLRSGLDGSVFDAISQVDAYPGFTGDPAPRAGGLFDLAAGGLRVVEQDTGAHVYRLAGTGVPGEACAATGLPSPCLVSRLETLAHERLATVSQLASTLSGRIELEEVAAPPPPLLSRGEAPVVAGLVLLAVALAVVGLVRARRRARRATAFGQVRVAAADARRAVARDRTLAHARGQIDELLDRAGELERGRRACAARLRKLDPAALAARREDWSRSQARGAADALAVLAAESDEGDRLAADMAAAVAGLERIAAALRIVPLRAREGQGTEARLASKDPVDALLGELATRDDAAGEADRVVN